MGNKEVKNKISVDELLRRKLYAKGSLLTGYS